MVQNVEKMPLRALRSLQLQKLQKLVKFVGSKSNFYKKKKGISPKSARFNSLEEFSKNIPLTTKEDVISMGTYDNLCVPRGQVVEIHFSSGTTKRPALSFYTKKDLDVGSEYLARTWRMQGVEPKSTFGMLASYGLFSAGLLNHYAIQKIGAFIVPIGSEPVLKVIDLFKTFVVDSCAAVASFYLYLIRMAEMNGVRLKGLGLKHMIAGGEPFSEKQRRYVERKLNASLYNQYGLCEINTGLAGECSQKNGLHILADYVYPEIIDPISQEVLGDNKEGELVLSTFHKEASPLVRYRTGDITQITHDPCPCGRTMPRIWPIKRRVTDTFFYKGLKVEHPFITKLVESLSRYLNPYIWQMEIKTRAGKDEMALKIIPSRNNKKTLHHVALYLRSHLGFKVRIAVFSEDELAGMGKSKIKHFLDKRIV